MPSPSRVCTTGTVVKLAVNATNHAEWGWLGTKSECCGNDITGYGIGACRIDICANAGLVIGSVKLVVSLASSSLRMWRHLRPPQQNRRLVSQHRRRG